MLADMARGLTTLTYGALMALVLLASCSAEVTTPGDLAAGGGGTGGATDGGGGSPICGDCPGPDGDDDCSESCDVVAGTCASPDPDGSPCGEGRHCRNGVCGADHLWSKRFGAPDRNQRLSSMAATPSGELVIGGTLTGDVDFGTGLVAGGQSSQDWTAFFAVFSADGDALQARSFGPTDGQSGMRASAYPGGGIVVGGNFYDEIDLGGGNFTGAGSYDAYLARFDAAYEHFFSLHIGQQMYDDTVSDFAVTGTGDIIVGGAFEGTMQIGTFTLTNVAGASTRDAYLAKVTAAGEVEWARRYGASGSEPGVGITLDANGDIILTTSSFDAVDFGEAQENAGSRDAYVIRLDADGNHLWTRAIAGPSDDRAGAVLIDAAGVIYVCGSFEGALLSAGAELRGAGERDAFLVALQPTGELSWARALGGPNEDSTCGLAWSPVGNFVVGFTFDESTEVAGHTFVGAGGRELLTFEMDVAGNLLWARVDGGTDSDDLVGLIVTADGTYLGGSVWSPLIDFGGNPLPAQGGIDIVLAKLAP
jgi:hypothetical protein